MKVVNTYSFKGGEAFLKNNHPNELREVLDAVKHQKYPGKRNMVPRSRRFTEDVIGHLSTYFVFFTANSKLKK